MPALFPRMSRLPWTLVALLVLLAGPASGQDAPPEPVPAEDVTLTAVAERWLGQARTWVENDLPGLAVRLLGAVFTLIVFRVLSGVVRHVVNRALSTSRMKVSDMLRAFFVGVASKAVTLFGMLFALGVLGVELGPVLAGVGVAGFVIGFALQDTLGNFAAGIMILLYRPFELGHVITAAGVTGSVADLTLVSTTLHTPDNQVIVVPNSKVWGGTIVNVTAQPRRRVDLVVGIGYRDDIGKAIAVVARVLAAQPLVLKDPAPACFVANLGESSVDLGIHSWCKTGDFLTVAATLRRELKERFDAEGISIPFPQRDVHVFNKA